MSALSENAANDLRWYFQESHAECEVPFLAASLYLDAEIEADISEKVYRVDAITRAKGIRRRLLTLAQPHADVVAWMFEQRRWAARILTLLSHPGVAMRTSVAQRALAVDGHEERDGWGLGRRSSDSEPFDATVGDFHRWRRPTSEVEALEALVVGMKPQGDTVKAMRAEASRRVADALKAYEASL